jgi:hypothetical protein
MRHLCEIFYLARDFVGVARGKDYFHTPQGLGPYFSDPRCYYNDLRSKADWNGLASEDVPLLYLPALRRTIQFPIMILQYGLGSFDRWVLEGDDVFRAQVCAVVRWIVNNLDSRGSFRNYFPQWMPTLAFHSDNSAMAQGEALSLLARAVRYDAVSGALQQEAESVADRIVANMLLPLNEGGTRCDREGSVYFCELCCVEPHIIVNGWIFALFGLQDYCDWKSDVLARTALETSLDTLQREVSCFLLPSGWSWYDNRGRIASPFYHHLHIALLEAQARLSNSLPLAEAVDQMRRGNTVWNRARYTAAKVKDKLLDNISYATSASISIRPTRVPAA